MIPRERGLRRFYVRMDRDNFTLEDVMLKVTNAIQPYFIKINKLDWYTTFSVKESVASKFMINNKIFLLGDACHIHSVNGGQGLNTGLSDAFNLIWKIKQVILGNEDDSFLQSYEDERKTIAKSVIDVSGKLVRTTKFSKKYKHAKDYIKLIKEHAGNITGMGIKYPGDCLVGNRLYDFELENGTRLYDQLSYSNYTIINFKDATKFQSRYPEIYVKDCPFMDYKNKILFVRPDGHIQAQY
jgi:3-(3-hydroxy-phenyl)propionate hydroxylase